MLRTIILLLLSVSPLSGGCKWTQRAVRNSESSSKAAALGEREICRTAIDLDALPAVSCRSLIETPRVHRTQMTKSPSAEIGFELTSLYEARKVQNCLTPDLVSAHRDSSDGCTMGTQTAWTAFLNRKKQFIELSLNCANVTAASGFVAAILRNTSTGATDTCRQLGRNLL